nr:hypothetical protein [Bacteroidota bacterium]
LYRSDMHPKSLELLSAVYAKNRKAADIEYDLARANHFNYKFDEAIALVTKYEKNTKITEKQKKDAQQLIEYCNNAKIQVAAPVDASIENIGDFINTVSEEYVPVVSSDESVMIFTYRGDQSTGGLQNAYNQPDPMGTYYEDVFISYKENNTWSTAASIGSAINTNVHDAAIAISNDGQKFFVFKDDGTDGGDVYLSRLNGIDWSVPEKLKGDINSSYWEGSVSLSADEKTLYFSSERNGGLGGRDMYRATLQVDGSWGNVQNLGTTVNTAYDDDAPFIHPDGKTLMYSSKGLNSMGGYDIFITELNSSDSSWSTPKNIGYPINTPDDDRYFVLNADATRGYYASGKGGGFGLHDIYKVNLPESFMKPVIAMVKGKITLDDKPVMAEIVVDNISSKSNYGQFSSNVLDGDYLVNIGRGSSYKFTYRLQGFPDKTETVDITTLSAYLEKVIDVKFYTAKDTTQKADSLTIAKADTTKQKPLISDVISQLGNSTKEGLEFKVQIAAYNLAKNYKYDFLKPLGRIEKIVLEDGITRFTVGGSFYTLNAAIEFKNKVRAAGQSDAFVTAIYQGKRVYLEELEKLGLIPGAK